MSIVINLKVANDSQDGDDLVHTKGLIGNYVSVPVSSIAYVEAGEPGGGTCTVHIIGGPSIPAAHSLNEVWAAMIGYLNFETVGLKRLPIAGDPTPPMPEVDLLTPLFTGGDADGSTPSERS